MKDKSYTKQEVGSISSTNSPTFEFPANYSYTSAGTSDALHHLESKIDTTLQEISTINSRLANIELALKHIIPHALEKINNKK